MCKVPTGKTPDLPPDRLGNPNVYINDLCSLSMRAHSEMVLTEGPVQGGLMRSERKHGLSTEQFPVSAYVGSSKNLKGLKGAVSDPDVLGSPSTSPFCTAIEPTL